ncbi:vitamin H transporter [Aspergillus brunneoviolaceus CBS 621.78]|uniref:Vitamin H transporter n=2 Tax=Aspergillus TaxID=5052 RepID=A0A8G1VW74_9EURO|nr:vitamin H transporter [Aspergillus brunneoviolaceus CBS 621.78]XP_040795701.1 vitamin H transporter [Aspergillus fijiensis CBS 313.89]RAH41082.1 vitamin H transporter [Aspergillus brunneoviolaceus CBS 621.78]RAK71689.1 vitamin H transporter [Aspergillus fijiensis CBS 313.89]
MEKQEIEPRVVEASTPDFDPALEKKLLRKLDWRVIPALWFLFLVSFMDRSNIANAKIAGMAKELHLVGNEYNLAVTMFTVAYVVFGMPANLLVKKFGPRMLVLYMFTWGLFVMGQGLTKTATGLIACRFFMGMCEAGFVPGCAYLIGSYYKRDEFLRRYAIFFSANMAAGAFNGLFSSLLTHLELDGYAGWRWLFLIESIITMGVSIICYWIVVPFPEDATFLTPAEKELLLARLEADGGSIRDDPISLPRVLKMAMDWKIWICVLAYLAAEESASSMVYFQPTILKDLGWTSRSAQEHSIPVYAVAFVLTLSSAWLSDYLRHRYLFTLFGSALVIIGWSIELAQVPSAGVRYMGMFFVASGAFIMMSITVVWLCINLGKGVKRSVGMGLLPAFGNCGAFVSGNVFITSEAPKYPTGFGVGLAFAVVAGLACTVYFFALRAENRRRESQPEQDWQSESMQDLGDAHPDFRFQL